MLELYIYKREKHLNKKINYYRKFLSPIEKDRALKFVQKKDAENFIISRYMIKNIIGKFFQISPFKIFFNINNYGRPFLKLSLGRKIDFNISHSSDLVAVAVSDQGRVGIDVQKKEKINLDIIYNNFHSQEIDYILNSPNNRIDRFYQVWSLKEAYTKALGKGLFYPWQNFNISFGKNIKISDPKHKNNFKLIFRNVFQEYIFGFCGNGRPSVFFIKFLDNIKYE